jgi:hypothetical protein
MGSLSVSDVFESLGVFPNYLDQGACLNLFVRAQLALLCGDLVRVIFLRQSAQRINTHEKEGKKGKRSLLCESSEI